MHKSRFWNFPPLPCSLECFIFNLTDCWCLLLHVISLVFQCAHVELFITWQLARHLYILCSSFPMFHRHSQKVAAKSSQVKKFYMGVHLLDFGVHLLDSILKMQSMFSLSKAAVMLTHFSFGTALFLQLLMLQQHFTWFKWWREVKKA